MSRSSARRAQTRPVVALVAVLAAVAGVGLYVDAAGSVAPSPPTRDRATPVLERLVTELRPGAVLRPSRLDAAMADRLGPAGFHVRVVVRAGSFDRAVGPEPPGPDAGSRATRAVPVRVGPDTVQAGRLRVVVWS